ncbi:MAG TPA: transaldolase [Ignavibacteriaceae bacterium]|nr:transaldolase [Ignavibacteriaceae bacterium]
MSKMIELAKLGQSIWFDYIKRDLITSGELQRLIDMGLRGMTSNPTIFDKAISGSTNYDDDIRQLLSKDLSIEEIYELLALKDIAMAADLLLPVYKSTNGYDGYVSIEVNPHLAHKTNETIEQAKRLFKSLDRPNIMIKIPATLEGLPAITEVIGSGINVNVTLIFSNENYKLVAEAYIKGLEKLDSSGGDVSKIASVASFFVSRVDTSCDKELEAIGNKELQGKIAIANSKVAYELSHEIFSGERWNKLKSKGAKVQRLLWASTGTKNPDYPDTLYVDELIGADTINTIPPATLDAFLDHGKLSITLDKNLKEAKEQLTTLAHLGIDLEKITDKLQTDGVKSFADSFDSLLKSISEKVETLKKEK